MQKYTLVSLDMLNEDYIKLKALSHLLNLTQKETMELGIKLSLTEPLDDVISLRKKQHLCKASQLSLNLTLVELGETVNICANNIHVLYSKLISTLNKLSSNEITYKLGSLDYTYNFLQHVNVNHLTNEHRDKLQETINNLFERPYVVISLGNKSKLFNRESFIKWLIELYNHSAEDKIPQVYLEGSFSTREELSSRYSLLPLLNTEEEQFILGHSEFKEYDFTQEVENMLQQIKYFLKKARPLTENELNNVSISKYNIKTEIGELGSTFDDDLFELLAVLEVQVGHDKLRNLNNSLRILVALQKGLKQIELSETEIIDTRNLVLPKKFIPFKPIDALHTYCGILSLTATKSPLSNLEVTLDYLKSRLKGKIKEEHYALAFVDGIIRYLNRKDNTNIQPFKNNWSSQEPLIICEKFINDAFTHSDVLRGNAPNQIYFLYYTLYNLL